MSSVWDYATKRKNARTKELEAQCGRCNKIIKCSGNSTTTLKNHLKLHGIDLDKSSQGTTSREEPVNEKRTKTIVEFFQRKSLKEIISDLATDGITIRAITRNSYIKQSIIRDGFKLPATERDVMKLIHEDFDEKKNKMIAIIKGQLEKHVKFSMSVDEYTTVRGRRFFGVNLHSSDNDKATIKTGLVRIFGSCTALDMVEAMEQHLAGFGIIMSRDIVGSTQDGAAVNKKYIRHIDAIGQFCLNHALHLGVCDTLYKKRGGEDYADQIMDSNEIEELDNFDEGMDLEVLPNNDLEQEEVDYHELLEKARKLVKFIKRSPVRNNAFLNKTKEKFGHEIELHLDIKTRWNSIPTMIEPLVKTETAIRETLTAFKALDMIETLDFTALNLLLKAMDPVKLAVENLSREDATLISAEKILQFMFNKISNIDSEISNELKKNLKIRVDERINDDVMKLLRSLKDTAFPPSKSTLTFAGNLASRLFGVSDANETVQQSSNIDENENLSLQDELNILLQKEESPAQFGGSDFKWLKSEFTLFKNTGQRTENLQKLYNALLSIKPTSTDVERVFSVCTYFCTKIRSRLSDKSLQSLVFLKYYYDK